MKQTKTKTLCLLLAALMLLSSLTACGKDKAKDSNLIKLGDYELLYKGACIMEDSDGNDAIVLSLDFTNNSKENASYLWSVDETLMQNGTELEVATVYTDYNTFTTVIENQFEEVAPGATLEVQTAFVLNNASGEIEATFEEQNNEIRQICRILIFTSSLSLFLFWASPQKRCRLWVLSSGSGAQAWDLPFTSTAS